jgi:hypothetical protein
MERPRDHDPDESRTALARVRQDDLDADDKARAASAERNLALITEFAERHRAIVLGETEFKLEQIERQAEAYRQAGADSIAVEQWASAERLRISRDGIDGVKRALDQLVDYTTDTARQMEDLILGAFNSMTAGITDFFDYTKEGFLDLRGLVNKIATDIMRMLLDMAVQMAVGAAFKGMGGGLTPRADGGPVRPGQTYLVGEKGPEILMMRSGGGDVIPLRDLPGRADGGPVRPGQTYIVGEKGPEILAMSSGGGTVLPLGSSFAGRSLPGRASGGSVLQREAYVVGEDGPEILQMGVRAGNVVPNGAMGGGDPEVKGLLRAMVAAVKEQKGARIVNVSDPAIVEDYLTSSAGERVVLNVLKRNRGAVQQAVS